MLWIILGLRVCLLLMAALCLWRMGSSLLALWRGSQSLAEVGRAVQAFFALSVITGQVFYLMWSTLPVLILALTFANIALGLSIWANLRARGKGLARLDAMIDRPDLALPLVELSEFDEETARQLAQQARQVLAARKNDA